MPEIRCSPDEVAVSGETGAPLLATLLGAGVPIAHACGGQAKCSTCRVRVLDGTFAARPDDEAAMAARLGFDDATRLACRARPCGDVTVRRLVLDDVDLRLSAARAKDPGPVGCEVERSILFADVAGFTALSEHLPAYDVVHLLERWFAAAGPAVERHGGRIDNYMGDGLMALFGTSRMGEATPAAGADSALAAVRAGLDLVAAAADVARYTREAYGRPFAVRVGVHHGTLVVGTLGAAHNRRETAIGDAVNVAARLEAANKAFGSSVLVSGEVARLVGGAFRLGRSAELPLQGKSGTHRVHEVLGVA